MTATNYDGHPFPRQDIAVNVLEDMGVPREKAEEVLQRIESSARSVGFVEEIKGKLYVSLQGSSAPQKIDDKDEEEEVNKEANQKRKGFKRKCRYKSNFLI